LKKEIDDLVTMKENECLSRLNIEGHVDTVSGNPECNNLSGIYKNLGHFLRDNSEDLRE
jgi:heat shock protein HslJ